MNIELIRTLKIIDKNEYEEKTVKELSILLIKFHDNSLREVMVSHGNFAFDSSIIHPNDINPSIKDGSIYFLKDENQKKNYGIAIITTNENNSTSCYLSYYAVNAEYNPTVFEMDFMKIICENLKNRGFSEMVLTSDNDSNYNLKTSMDNLGLDTISLRIYEYIC